MSPSFLVLQKWNKSILKGLVVKEKRIETPLFVLISLAEPQAKGE